MPHELEIGVAHAAVQPRLQQAFNVDHRWFDLAAVAGVIAAFGFLLWAFWGQSYDDVYLAFRYAQNIERGAGFVFNPGEHFLGTPAPLFVGLLVALHGALPWLTIPQVGSVLSCLGLALSGGAVYLCGRQVNQRLLAALAALLLMFNPFTLLVLGGETPLYLAFVTIAMFCFITKRFFCTGVLLGLALLNRSEAVVPLGLLCAVYLFEQRRLPWRIGLAAGVVVLPWVVFAWATFGSPLTNSFTAKIAQVAAGATRYPLGLVRWLAQITVQPNPLYWAVVPLLMFGVCALPFAARPWRILVAWAVLLTLAYASLPIPFYHWYAAQVGVLCAILVALGAVTLPAAVRRTQRRWLRSTVWLGMISIVLVTLSGTLLATFRTTASYQAQWPHGPANHMYQNAGAWLGANTPPGSRIAYLEIGQISFYSDRYIIDTLGLVTPGVAPQVAQKNWLWPLLHYKPDYIIYNPMFSGWTDSDAMFDEDWFVSGFTAIKQIDTPEYPVPLTIYQRRPGASIPNAVTQTSAVTKSEKPVGEIYASKSVSQAFRAPGANLQAIALNLATYQRTNHSTVTVSLRTQNGLVAQWQVPARMIRDNTWRRFYLPTAVPAADTRFMLTVETDATGPEQAITIWRTTSVSPDTALHYDGKLVTGTLNFRTFSGD